VGPEADQVAGRVIMDDAGTPAQVALVAAFCGEMRWLPIGRSDSSDTGSDRVRSCPSRSMACAGWLRQDRGAKVPIVVGRERAYIAVAHRAEQKRTRQALIITREKENMKPTVIARRAYDPASGERFFS